MRRQLLCPDDHKQTLQWAGPSLVRVRRLGDSHEWTYLADRAWRDSLFWVCASPSGGKSWGWEGDKEGAGLCGVLADHHGGDCGVDGIECAQVPAELWRSLASPRLQRLWRLLPQIPHHAQLWMCRFQMSRPSSPLFSKYSFAKT